MKVIRRAQDEADGRHLYTGDVAAMRYRARRWLTTKSRSFMQVCELAGLTEGQAEQLLRESIAKYGKVGSRKQ